MGKYLAVRDLLLGEGTLSPADLLPIHPLTDEQLAGARFDFCIHVAGVDPLLGDRYGRLALTLEGLAERDRLVFATCRDRAIPIVSVMGGGYSRDLARTVVAHANTVRVAARVFAGT